ncbi:ADP-ribosylglycohydrolase family protein [Streptomyces sp. MST-110588]|uniref:ADP-ribosylglycohydrolase family protein n=1 Tax=Streptomyces sp. MST-110588 TaxID=2833628 RepID=UPI0032428E50
MPLASTSARPPSPSPTNAAQHSRHSTPQRPSQQRPTLPWCSGGAASRTQRVDQAQSPLLAAVLAHAYADSPEAGLLLAANTLGSDTDTIATMAGALLGVVTAGPRPAPCKMSR